MFNEQQQQVIKDFVGGVHADAALDDKTRHLIKIGCAAIMGCYPCMEELFSTAAEKGLTQDQVGAALLTGMFVAAGATKNKAMEVWETRVNK